MTAPATPTPTNTAPNIRFGKNARMYIALDDGSGVAPAFDAATAGGATSAWQYFCATSQLEIGGQKGSETVNNFCTGGNDVAVNDGSETNTITTGDATWAENDRAIAILERAYATDARVHYLIFPLGMGNSAVVFRGLLDVREWKLTIPSKGLIKMTNGLSPLGRPERGTMTDGVFTATDYSAALPTAINGGALTDAQATNLQAMSANQEANYTLTSASTGDIVATAAGTSNPVTVAIVSSTGQVLASGTNTATASAQPAGSYTVRVSSASGSTGGTLTVDFASV